MFYWFCGFILIGSLQAGTGEDLGTEIFIRRKHYFSIKLMCILMGRRTRLHGSGITL